MSAYPGVLLTGNGSSGILMIDPVVIYAGGIFYGLGVICTVSNSASLTYSVQVTGDVSPSASGNWNNHDTLQNLTSSANGNIAYPITGMRLMVSNYSSGSVNMGVTKWP